MSKMHKSSAGHFTPNLPIKFSVEILEQIETDIANGAVNLADISLPPLPDPREAAADAVEAYIRQFEDTVFGQVIRIGDPKKYRDAVFKTTIIPNANIDAEGRIKVKRYLFDYAGAPYTVIYLPFDPRRNLVPKQKQTLHHEVTHQIEWLHNDLRGRDDPTSERNTDYLDRLVNHLNWWRRIEQQLIEGTRSTDEAAELFSYMENYLFELETQFKPDFLHLQVWCGVYSIPANGIQTSAGGIHFKDIRDHYLKSDINALRQLAENHTEKDTWLSLDAFFRIGCNAWNHPLDCPCDFPPRPKNQIAGQTIDLSY